MSAPSGARRGWDNSTNVAAQIAAGDDPQGRKAAWLAFQVKVNARRAMAA